jgi:hypothetical protein
MANNDTLKTEPNVNETTADDQVKESDATSIGVGNPQSEFGTVQPASSPTQPVARDDYISIVDYARPIFDVLWNDSDADGDELTVIYASAAIGDVSINSDGTLSYIPETSFTGSTQITYTISDGAGLTDTANARVTIGYTSDVVYAAADTATVTEDTTAIIDVLANDYTPHPYNVLSVIEASSADGTVTTNSDGTLSFLPNSDLTGTATISYTMSSGGGNGQDTATVTVYVTPEIAENTVPVARGETYTTTEDAPSNLNVLWNDSDADGDELTVIYASSDNGDVSVNSDGTLSYTPETNFTGTSEITYTISDGTGATDSATVTVSVWGTNDAVVAAADTATVTEDTTAIIDVLANDYTPNPYNELTVLTASSADGTVTTNSDGTLSFLPNSDFTGTATISYTMSSGGGNGQDTATVTVYVTPEIAENTVPVARDDTAIIAADVPTDLTVLDNDSDGDGDDLTVIYASSATGDVSINSDGTLSFTAETDFTGTSEVTYTISDGTGGTDSATAHLFIVSTNTNPIAEDDSYDIAEDVPTNLNVLWNDSDADGDELTVIYASSGNGDVSINSDGTLSYTPETNFTGTTEVTYTISDGTGATDSATVTVSVWGTNAAVVATADTATVTEDTTAIIDVLANDYTPNPYNELTVLTASSADGTVTTNSDGALSFLPNSDFTGTATISYTMSGGGGNGQDTATVTVYVTPEIVENTAPVAHDETITITENSIVTTLLSGNDSDPDGDDLTVIDASSANGDVSINSNGTLTFTPETDFTGTTAVTYTISDGSGGTDSATAHLNILSTNTNPVAVDDVVITAEDLPTEIDVLNNDSDFDGDDLTVIDASSVNGDVSINSDGTLTFVPETDFTGTTAVTYTISDGYGGLDTATVHVTVYGAAPEINAVDDTATIDEGTSLTIDPTVNDDAYDAILTLISASSDVGSVYINSNGTLTFTPDSDFTGTSTIDYTISEGTGATDSGTINVSVTNVNEAPVANDDSATNILTSIDVLTNDSDVDEDTLTVISASSIDGSVTINSDGTLDFTPTDQNYFGTATVTYVISDGEGGTDSADLNVEIYQEQSLPVAEDDAAIVAADVPTDLTVLGNDSDADGDDLTVIYASSATGDVSINSDGTLLFTAETDFTGTSEVTYTISDGTGGTDSATVTVSVIDIYEPPVAVDDTATVTQDGDVTIDVLANDSDAEGQNLTIVNASSTDGEVTINSDGTISFDPHSSFTGTATISYTISNGDTETDMATVSVNVTCFARGTNIRMADGSQALIENLSAGAMIETMDHGAAELRWIGSRSVPANRHTAPIVITAGALGNDVDLRVSPQHRMLITDWRAQLLFGVDSVLIAAKDLVNNDTIYVEESAQVEYFHMLFDTHEIVFANNAPSESFHPGEYNMGEMEAESRAEILALFPELRNDNNAFGQSVRASLNSREALLLRKSEREAF